MTPPDSELIASVVGSDDHAAFGELVTRHQSAVRRFLRHLAKGDAALADDLAQETFLQAYQSLAKFRGAAAFSTWLLGIAFNQWRNARRRYRPSSSESDGATDAAVASTVDASDLRHDLALALATLSPDERLSIHLHYEQGLSHAEMAELLAWPLGTVKTHLLRAKDRLRPLMAAWNPRP